MVRSLVLDEFDRRQAANGTGRGPKELSPQEAPKIQRQEARIQCAIGSALIAKKIGPFKADLLAKRGVVRKVRGQKKRKKETQRQR